MVALVGVGAGVAFCAWVAWHNAQPFQAEVYGYRVVNSTRTTVTLDVYRSKAVALNCQVYAQAEDKHIVGEKTVVIPASSAKKVRVHTSIVTERLATTGTLRSCSVTK